MKKLLIILYLWLPVFAWAQTKPVRIVFDVTTGDAATHEAVLRHVKGLAKSQPDAQLEVVVYGAAWPMLTRKSSETASQVEELASMKNVDFKLCGVTMERQHVKPEELVTGVQVVPDGILEIVARQSEGWGYIKETPN